MSSELPLIERYLEHVRVQRRLAERSLTLYAGDLQRLAGEAGRLQLPLTQVQSTHVRRWVAQLHAGGRNGRGIARLLSSWRGFYRWLGLEGLVSSNPVQDVRAPKAAKPLPKALSVDQAVQLAAHEEASADPWLEARDAAIVELLYGCGLRMAELTGLDAGPGPLARGWIDLAGAEAHVLGKGGKRRSVPVGTAALQALQQWLAVRASPPSAASAQQGEADLRALFISQRGRRLGAQAIWLRLRERSLRAGLAAPVHPHMLRHSFASHVLQSSGDLRAVQELLGHANISTTQVYTRLDYQHLARAYDAAHPRARRAGPRPDTPEKSS